MDVFLSFMSQSVLSILCLSAQTNAISGSEANVMSNKFLSHIDQVDDIEDPMNTLPMEKTQSGRGNSDSRRRRILQR